jgi:hypothetical protein
LKSFDNLNNYLFLILGRNLSLADCIVLSAELRANGFEILKREIRPAIAGGGF